MIVVHKATGKVGRIPDNAYNPSVYAPYQAPSGGGESSGAPPEKTAFLQAMMQKPSQAASLKSVYEFMYPQENKSALPAAEQRRGKMTETSLRLLDKLQTEIPSFEGTGPIPGFLTSILRNVAPSMADEKLSTMQSRLGPISSNLLYALSGVATSPHEEKRLRRFIPSTTKSKRANEIDLQSLLDYLNTEYETIYSTPYKSKGGTRPPLSSFEE